MKCVTAIVFVGAMIGLSWVDRRGHFLRPHPPVGRFNAVATAVVDTQTIEVLRPSDRSPLRIELLGIELPPVIQRSENTDRLAAAAIRTIEQLCTGKRVTVTARRHRQHPERFLAYVQLNNGTVLQEHLLAAGLARATDHHWHDRSERFALLQKQAQRDQRGLWTPPSLAHHRQPKGGS